eukprot:3215728-Pleurochrysis_carterae.AAC.1
MKGVYEKTNGEVAIGKQSDMELQSVMVHTVQRHYEMHLPVMELNRIVVNHCVQNILQNIGYYLTYIRDISAPRSQQGSVQDMLMPVNTRSSTERTARPVF